MGTGHRASAIAHHHRKTRTPSLTDTEDNVYVALLAPGTSEEPRRHWYDIGEVPVTDTENLASLPSFTDTLAG